MSNNSLKSELVMLLRNSDILTTTQRSVTTTTTDAIALTGATSYTLNITNVKNIRSLTIGTTLLKYGTDYTLDLDFLDTTKKCKITFRSAQTGNMVIVYDAGTDKIFSDYPRVDLTIGSYPRIAVEEISKSVEPFSLGGKDFISTRSLTIVLYAEDQDWIERKLDTIETLIKSNAKSLYYAKFISPTSRGPIIKHEARNQTLLQKNIDVLAKFEVENVN